MLVLLDNTVLSNFAQANLTSVIYALWKGQVGTTVEAISEYQAGIKSVGLSASAWKSLQIIESTSEESNFGASLSAKLGRGERSCVAVAYLRNALFATDDLLA